ncbi:VPLPA-CTERM sorting domain-containing protein [Rhodovulum sulfidophilum]|uniref:VPLPA-CTERM sorting domain-containing protein n=1 Tax=Rhodovulum sulfidophilum TaxID=35806 RepID=A0ABS1RVH6_RHOSU|nr:VPLPA-CTERM sorting domain-containing protein [Rhodovulum sulfidophilum]MBL3610099.1 VPLPA-CTERM sorting domain-containing protein [Rhodovulum sulfidophilum]MCE8458199.1 VPLPA-CTERM sorting domain-containing protein [Rhodovulum sulfidophilum]
MRLLFTTAAGILAAGSVHAATWTLASHADYAFLDDNQTGLQMTQGVAWNAEANEWVTSWQYGLARFTEDWQFIEASGRFDLETGRIVSGIPAALADRGFDHIGDFEIRDGIVHVPLDSADDHYQNGHVALFDAATLSYTGALHEMMGAPTNRRDDVASWTAIDHETGLGYGKEWALGDTLNVYDTTDWSYLGTLQMDQELKRVQGAKVLDGMMYLSTDIGTKSVYSLDLATGHVEELFQLPIFEGDIRFETEGLALRELADGGLEMFVEMVIDPDAVEGQFDGYTRLYRYVLENDPAPVPVPATLPLVLSGLAAFGLIRRRA